MDHQLTVGMLMSRVRVEEKLLLEELEAARSAVCRFDDREFTLDLESPGGRVMSFSSDASITCARSTRCGC